MPVVPTNVLLAEGPAFAETINRIDALLTTAVMRRLNQAVDIAGQDPAAVAQQFLETHGLITPVRRSRRSSRRAAARAYPLEPNPPVPRSEVASSCASTGSGVSIRTSTSWAIRSPAASSKRASRSVFSSSTRSSPR